jgi:hypothetical protein
MAEAHLTVWELFHATYLGLLARFPARTLRYTPPAGASAEVADDSDGHRNRTGVMVYDEVSIITVGPKRFLIGVGRPHGYPADPYAADILAIPLEVTVPETDWEEMVGAIIRESTYFRNTMLIGLRDDGTAVPKLSIYAKPAQAYFSDINAMVAETPEFNPKLLHGNGSPVAVKTMQFKRDAPVFFVDGCTAVLAASL